MKKILISLAVVGVVSAIVIGGTVAYFSDTETSTGNKIIAGTIDLTITGKTQTLPFELNDMKPGYNEIVIKKIKVTSNPSNVWMRIGNFSTGTGAENGSECKAEGGTDADPCDNNTEQNDLHNQIYYDLSVCVDDDKNGDCNGSEEVIYSFDEKDLETLSSLKNKWIPLKMSLSPGIPLLVMQSFHFNEQAGNKYQGDWLTFDEEFVAYQEEATSPTGNILYMENKNPDTWKAIADEMKGELLYNSAGENFEYTFEATGLTNSGNYSLIYYADCDVDGWPGNCPGALIATFTADSSGTIIPTLGSIDLSIDLPCSTDYNYPAGAKIWLVPSSDYDQSTVGSSGGMSAWNPTQYLFENNPTLIQYDDTDI